MRATIEMIQPVVLELYQNTLETRYQLRLTIYVSCLNDMNTNKKAAFTTLYQTLI